MSLDGAEEMSEIARRLRIEYLPVDSSKSEVDEEQDEEQPLPIPDGPITPSWEKLMKEKPDLAPFVKMTARKQTDNLVLSVKRGQSILQSLASPAKHHQFSVFSFCSRLLRHQTAPVKATAQSCLLPRF